MLSKAPYPPVAQETQAARMKDEKISVSRCPPLLHRGEGGSEHCTIQMLLLGPLEETPQPFITHANQREQGSARRLLKKAGNIH